MEIFAKRIKELRLEKGLTVVKMGELLKMTHNAYLRYEHNTSEPTQKNLVILAKFFGVSTDYLLGLSDV